MQKKKTDLQTEEEEWDPLVDFPSKGLGLVVDEGGREGHQQIQGAPHRPKPKPRGPPATPADINKKLLPGGRGRGGVLDVHGEVGTCQEVEDALDKLKAIPRGTFATPPDIYTKPQGGVGRGLGLGLEVHGGGGDL